MADTGTTPDEAVQVRFYIEGEHSVAAYARLFAALDDFYDDCALLQQLSEIDVAAMSNDQRGAVRDVLALAMGVWNKGKINPPRSVRDVMKFSSVLWEEGFIAPPEPLWLQAISAASPGSVDLLGLGKILEQIRLGLVDRKQRKKDKAYRDDAEKEQLRLENLLREIEAAQKVVDLASSLGLPNEEALALVRRTLAPGAAALLEAQDDTGFGRELPEGALPSS